MNVRYLAGNVVATGYNKSYQCLRVLVTHWFVLYQQQFEASQEENIILLVQAVV